MSDNQNEQPWSEWLTKAEEDLISLESLVKHQDGSPSTGCFLAQQIAEKYLKALVIFVKLEVEKTHDLLKLSLKLEFFFPEITQQLKNELTELTRYYIETRYPGDYPEFYWKQCQEAYEMAKKIKDFVVDKLG